MTDTKGESATPATLETKKSKSGRFSALLLLLLAIIAALYSAGWAYARSQYDKVIEEQLLILKEKGTDLACEDRKVGGYPFRLEVTCDAPVLERKGAPRLSAKELRSISMIWNPFFIILELDGPLMIEDKNQPPLRLEASTLRASINTDKGEVGRISISSENAALFQHEDNLLLAKAENVEAHTRKIPDTNNGDRDIIFIAKNAEWPDAPIRAQPFDAGFSATARAIEQHFTNALPKTLNSWIQSEPKLDHIRLKIKNRRMTIDTTGTLDVERNGLINGRGTVAVAGLDALLQTLGPGLLPQGLGGAATALFAARPVTLDDQEAQAFDITIANGKLRMGPLLITEIPPVQDIVPAYAP
jgi:hypothetical protein